MEENKIDFYYFFTVDPLELVQKTALEVVRKEDSVTWHLPRNILLEGSSFGE